MSDLVQKYYEQLQIEKQEKEGLEKEQLQRQVREHEMKILENYGLYSENLSYEETLALNLPQNIQSMFVQAISLIDKKHWDFFPAKIELPSYSQEGDFIAFKSNNTRILFPLNKRVHFESGDFGISYYYIDKDKRHVPVAQYDVTVGTSYEKSPFCISLDTHCPFYYQKKLADGSIHCYRCRFKFHSPSYRSLSGKHNISHKMWNSFSASINNDLDEINRQMYGEGYYVKLGCYLLFFNGAVFIDTSDIGISNSNYTNPNEAEIEQLLIENIKRLNSEK